MIKIFLTGDNHIGLKYSNHSNASYIIKSRIDAFEDMVNAANSECCSLFVVAGDLFENTYSIAKKDIKTILDSLSQFNGTVAILPGNHDYYDSDTKLWKSFNDLIKNYDNILLLNEYKAYEITLGDNEVVLYPAFCASIHSLPNQNNLDWIKNENIVADNKFRLGLAHGAVEGETIDNEGVYFLMNRNELDSIPVDAWLIGHTHVPFPRDLSENEYKECGKIFNAGTHVQTDVACNTDGECFIIDIQDNKCVKAKKYVSGKLRFYRFNLDVTGAKLEDKLNETLQNIDDNSIVDIIISGAVDDEEYQNRFDIIEKALSRFVEGTYNEHKLSRLISKSLIDKEFNETSVTAQLLTALIDEPKQAQLAYDMLQSLKENK